MFSKTKSKIMVAVAMILIGGMACNFVGGLVPNKPTTPPEMPPQDQGGPTPKLGNEQPAGQTAGVDYPKLQAGQVYLASFADYPAEFGQLPAAFEGGYGLPADLAKIKGIDAFELTKQQKDMLVKNGFVIQPPKPGEYREFYQVYESLRYMENEPVFITTDAVFHIYHLIFDKILRDLERQFFAPYLKRLTQSMIAACADQYQQLTGTPLEEPARRNLAYFVVAGQLQGLPDAVPAPVSDLVSKEVALISAHSGPAVAPI